MCVDTILFIKQRQKNVQMLLCLDWVLDKATNSTLLTYTNSFAAIMAPWIGIETESLSYAEMYSANI